MYGADGDAKLFQNCVQEPDSITRRVDEVLVFNRLTPEDMPRIVTAQLANTDAMLRAQGVGLSVTDEAKEIIASEGFSVEYGARPLRRYINRNVLDGVSELLLSGECNAGDTVEVRAAGGEGGGVTVAIVKRTEPLT